jgi:hypothetical protein
MRQILKERATDWESRFRNVEERVLNKNLSLRNEYLILAYFSQKFNKTLNPIEDMFADPEAALKSGCIDIAAHTMYFTAEHSGSCLFALNQLGLLNKEKIRYLLGKKE